MNLNGLVFLTGSCAYPTIEMMWRGHTHYSMAIAGGASMLLINKICCEKMSKKKILQKCIAGAAIITGIELAIGIIFNKVLKQNVWDYSKLPLNLLGQICIPYSLLWIGITIPAMALCRICKKAKMVT